MTCGRRAPHNASTGLGPSLCIRSAFDAQAFGIRRRDCRRMLSTQMPVSVCTGTRLRAAP